MPGEVTYFETNCTLFSFLRNAAKWLSFQFHCFTNRTKLIFAATIPRHFEAAGYRLRI